MSNEKLRLDNQLCHRFYVVSNAFTRAYRPLLDELNLTYPQYLSMLALWESSPMTASHLSEKTQIDAGAMTLMLKKLVEKGFIDVSPSEEDKRVKIVSLTEQGVTLRKNAEKIPEAIICQFPDVESQDMRDLIALIDKVKTGLTGDR